MIWPLYVVRKRTVILSVRLLHAMLSTVKSSILRNFTVVSSPRPPPPRARFCRVVCDVELRDLLRKGIAAAICPLYGLLREGCSYLFNKFPALRDPEVATFTVYFCFVSVQLIDLLGDFS